MSKKRITIVPDGKELLAELASRMDAQDLRLIAKSDYGDEDQKHFVLLQKIKETLNTDNLGCWYPLEVIELCRWHPHSSVSFRKGHEIRAFCCAILLHTHCDYNEPIPSCDSTIGNLLESLLRLDKTLIFKGQKLYSALLESKFLDNDDKVLVPICQLLHAMQLEDDTAIRSLLDKILDFEKSHSNDELVVFQNNSDFFAERDRPTMDTGWKFVSDYIYKTLPRIQDVELKRDLFELCKRLWNPEPDNYVIQMPFVSEL